MRINYYYGIEYLKSHPNYSAYIKYLSFSKKGVYENCYDKSEVIADMFNFGIIGNGERRVCVYYEDTVLKLPLESYHYQSNWNEIYLYNYVKNLYPVYLKYLCPILCSDGDYIVTPVCEELEDCDEHSVLVDKLNKMFLDIGIKFTDLDNVSQCGYCNNQLVILDYEDYEFV